MVHLQNTKKVLPIFQTSLTSGATGTGNVDTLGYDYVTIDVLLPTSDNATNNPSTLKISESDDTVVTNFADVTGLVGDTSFTIPNCATAATNITGPFVTFNISTKSRKRYLKLSITPLTTQVVNAIATLSRAETVPTSTTDINSLAVVNLV